MPALFKTFKDRNQAQITKPDWLAEGNRAYELQHYEEALADYEVALAQNGALVEAWSGKGATLLHLRHADKALVALDRALSLHPTYPHSSLSPAHLLHALLPSLDDRYS